MYQDFFRFVQRAWPLFSIKEAENDEYFISNIAVFPEQQGQGLGQYMLHQIETKARIQGFSKVSLTVDIENERALSLYKRMGFNIMETVGIEPLRRLIGYRGFHRMVKFLA